MKKVIKCPLCGKIKISKFWAMPGYKLARCVSCGMVWDYFPPDNLELQYEENYFNNDNPKGGYSNYFAGMSINRKTFRERIKRINNKVKNKGRLLDVGCAFGDCLLEAIDLGWNDVRGVELSTYAYKLAKQKGLNIINSKLESKTYPKNYFDVVTSQDVIEHIPSFSSHLKNIHTVLRPGGIVFIVTPDIGGSWRRLLGRFWYHYKPGEHVVYFSEKTIARALKNAGFNEIKTAKTYHIMSLEYILNRLRYYSPLIFGALHGIIVKTPLKSMSFKVYSGELEAWAQK